MNPKVSVIMSVLNGDEFLGVAVDSVLQQSLGDFEFIVIDNGSDDRTPEILDTYRDPRLVRLRNEQVLTLTQSLNRGLAAARAPYVARLDADDIAAPERLSRQLAYFDKAPETVLIGSHYRIIDERGRAVGLERPPCQPSELYQALAFSNPFAHSAVMFRRDAARAVGFYPAQFAYAQDLALWLALAGRGSLGMIGEPLVDLRKHSRQTSLAPLYNYLRYQEGILLFQRARGLPRLSAYALGENRKTLSTYRYEYAKALARGRRYPSAALQTALSVAAAPRYFIGRSVDKIARSLSPHQSPAT